MKKFFYFVVIIIFFNNYAYAQNTDKDENLREIALENVEIVAHLLKNISYTDSIIVKIGYGQEWAGMDLKTVTANANIKYTVGKWQITAGILSQTVDRGMLIWATCR